MRFNKRILALLLLLTMLFCSACNSDGGSETTGTGNNGGSDNSVTDQPTVTDKVVDPKDNLIVNGQTDYVITRPKKSDDATYNASKALSDAITQKTGLTLTLGNDGSSTVPECEIIVGPANRDVVKEFSSNIERSNDWVVARKGTKIVIYGTAAIGDAVNYFIDNYVVNKNINIPDGEIYTHTGNYTVGKLTLGTVLGADIKISYTKGLEDAQAAAEGLKNLISSSAGELVTINEAEFSGAVASGDIWFVRDTKLGMQSVKCELKNGGLLITCGEIGSFAEAVRLIGEQFKSANGADIDMSKITFEVEKSVENMTIADKAYFDTLEAKAQEMKDKVLNTSSEYNATGTTYYFAADGNDANDGKSESTPKQSLNELKNLSLKSGDVVLFKRGDTFRGTITAKGGVTYSAYGTGNKPVICGSDRNYADESLWKKTSYKNVWQCTLPLQNVGIAVFEVPEIGDYNAKIGDRMIKGRDGFEGVESMKKDLQVYSDLTENVFYVYSVENPGKRFSTIDIGQRKSVIAVDGFDVTVDNLHITVAGAHGVSAYTTKNLTVRNCVFNWIGGSILPGHGGGNLNGYGNAVEVYGGVDGYKVYNNWIYQIFDTGITHQSAYSRTVSYLEMTNIEYYDNLIEYTFWAIEYYNQGGKDVKRETRNVYVHDNFCRLSGYGWGCKGREKSSMMYDLWGEPDVTENYVTENNIFDRCLGVMLNTYGNPPRGIYKFIGNTYIQPYGSIFAYIEGGYGTEDRTLFTPEAAKVLKRTMLETDAHLVFIME